MRRILLKSTQNIFSVHLVSNNLLRVQPNARKSEVSTEGFDVFFLRLYHKHLVLSLVMDFPKDLIPYRIRIADISKNISPEMWTTNVPEIWFTRKEKCNSFQFLFRTNQIYLI